jgi:hypothetical protein
MEAAQSARATAQAAVTTIERRLAASRESVDQIDRALTAEKIAPLRPVVEPAQRWAPPIPEFDTIAMPREA